MTTKAKMKASARASAALPQLSLTFELVVKVECVGRADVIQMPVNAWWQVGLKSGLGLRRMMRKGPGFVSMPTRRAAGGVEAGA